MTAVGHAHGPSCSGRAATSTMQLARSASRRDEQLIQHGEPRTRQICPVTRGRHAAAVRRRRLHAHASAAVATAVTLAMTHGVNRNDKKKSCVARKRWYYSRAKAMVLYMSLMLVRVLSHHIVSFRLVGLQGSWTALLALLVSASLALIQSVLYGGDLAGLLECSSRSEIEREREICCRWYRIKIRVPSLVRGRRHRCQIQVRSSFR